MDDWKQTAAVAREKLRTARRGEKDFVLLQLAAGKRDPNTLRRMIFALDYLDDLARTAPRLRGDLETVPLSLIELLARWRAFDPKGATVAARETARGKHSVSSLSKAMFAARKAGGEGFDPSYRDNVGKAAIEAITETLGGTIKIDEHKDLIKAPPVDFDFVRVGRAPRRDERVAAVIIGPYTDPKNYAKRREEWLQRCFGIAWQYHHVVMLLPYQPGLESYRASLSDNYRKLDELELDDEQRIRRPSVHVLHPRFFPPLSAEDAESLSSIGR